MTNKTHQLEPVKTEDSLTHHYAPHGFSRYAPSQPTHSELERRVITTRPLLRSHPESHPTHFVYPRPPITPTTYYTKPNSQLQSTNELRTHNPTH